jgi:hypothetical protein
MVPMTAEQILASVDLPSAELDRTVAEFLDMSSRMEVVLADHFDLDAIAAGAEVLAHRLQSIRDVVAPMLEAEGYAGDLARAIEGLALPQDDVLGAVMDHAGLTGKARSNDDFPFTLGPSPVYGHPTIRQVSVLDLDPANGRINRSHYVIDTATGTIGGMGEHEVQASAASRLGAGAESSAA